LSKYLIERYIREEVTVQADTPREAILCATVPDSKDYRILEPYSCTYTVSADNVSPLYVAVVLLVFLVGYFIGEKWKQ
jgi:hypothetical protein